MVMAMQQQIPSKMNFRGMSGVRLANGDIVCATGSKIGKIVTKKGWVNGYPLVNLFVSGIKQPQQQAAHEEV